ncbi:helix-turn-helix domain-containing protein [Maricaulis sp. CAU 1757]
MFDANAIRLKACRRRGGLDQAELAQLVGTSLSTISRIECGQVRPDTLTLLTYELIFDIPAANLLPDTTADLRRRTQARAAKLLKRCEQSRTTPLPAKVEFIKSICRRFDGP